VAKLDRWGPQAESLYMEGNSPETISEKLGGAVSAKTVRIWANDGEWGRKRRLRLSSAEQLADRLERVLLRKLASLEDNPDLCDNPTLDGIHKGFATLDKIRKGKMALSTAGIEIMDLFSRFLASVEDDGDYLERTVRHIRAFLGQLEGR